MNYLLRAFLILALSGIFVLIHATGSTLVRSRQQQQNISVESNEGSAMKSLRTLLNAESKFQSTIGKGEYGYLKDLHEAALIDKVLASGTKDGYRFTIVIKKSTMATPPAIDLVARPGEYGKSGRRSFYLNESGVMLTSEVKDAPLASMSPFAKGGEGTKTVGVPQGEPEPVTEANEDEIASNVLANEASVKAVLAAIHSAETKYIAKQGAGAYGTLEQLEKAGLIGKTQSAVTQYGYLLEEKIGAAKPESPATYSISAVPQTYGVSGRNSFYVDQTGIVRGTDKDGGPADASDPPLK